METPGSAAARRKLLVDSLLATLERSKLRDLIEEATLRSVIEMAMPDMWRNREIWLEALWRMIRREPGLTREEAALPLLAFSTWEKVLDAKIRLPEELAVVPLEARMLARDALHLGEDVVEKILDDYKQEFDKEQALEAARLDSEEQDAESAAMRGAPSGDAPAVGKKPTTKSMPVVGRGPTTKSQPAIKGKSANPSIAHALGTASYSDLPPELKRKRRIRYYITAGIVIVGISVGSGAISFFQSHSFGPATPENLDNVAEVLKLRDGKRSGTIVTAFVDDPRWKEMSMGQRQAIAMDVYVGLRRSKGITRLELHDPATAVNWAMSGSGSVAVENIP